MTYRKLFLLTLVASSLLLAGAWMHSLWKFTHIAYSWSGSMPLSQKVVFGTLASGTVTLGYLPQAGCFPPIVATIIPLSEIKREGRPEAWGRFGLGNAAAYGYHPDYQAYLMEFPVWIPCLLFTVTAYSLFRFTERRVGMPPTNLKAPTVIT
ncbi:MAG: hypothetical protein EOP85_14425 [Verrucomicrobiaceae bacterium]|nr:MAG: hypothetical protein EOP85_14425 [Verrucomicrobiaceae bacterium]